VPVQLHVPAGQKCPVQGVERTGALRPISAGFHRDRHAVYRMQLRGRVMAGSRPRMAGTSPELDDGPVRQPPFATWPDNCDIAGVCASGTSVLGLGVRRMPGHRRQLIWHRTSALVPCPLVTVADHDRVGAAGADENAAVNPARHIAAKGRPIREILTSLGRSALSRGSRHLRAPGLRANGRSCRSVALPAALVS
jgi:hypothetical protein